MSAAYFYIDYTDGRFTQINFKTQAMARKAYQLYDKEPEDDAKSWGWQTEYDTPTITQQIHAKRAMQ